MTVYIILFRGVGGATQLPTKPLREKLTAAGFKDVATYINSGNLLFTSDLDEGAVQGKIGKAIEEYFGKPVRVLVRSAGEMAQAAAANPFPDDKPSAVMANFIDEEPVQSMLDEARDVRGERMALGPRLIYVAYGEGIADSKLKLPALKQGTARNMNSVAKMAEMLAGME